jgi:arginyl-tRNA synthetase
MARLFAKASNWSENSEFLRDFYATKTQEWRTLTITEIEQTLQRIQTKLEVHAKEAQIRSGIEQIPFNP